MVLTRSPIIPEMSPFTIDSPAREAIIVSPNTASRKNSWGPNLREKSASGGATSIKTTVLKKPPQKEATTAPPRAFPASPFLVIS